MRLRCSAKTNSAVRLCFVLGSSLAVGFAQQTSGPNLALSIQPEEVSRTFQTSYVAWLTNTTTHIVRLPKPMLNCSALPLGELQLGVDYTPFHPAGPPQSRRCIADFSKPERSVLDHISEWHTLLPGDSWAFPLRYEEIASTPPQPGTYIVWAVYAPPYLSPAEKAELALRGIDIPDAELTSAKLTYTFAGPERKPR